MSSRRLPTEPVIHQTMAHHLNKLARHHPPYWLFRYCFPVPVIQTAPVFRPGNGNERPHAYAGIKIGTNQRALRRHNAANIFQHRWNSPSYWYQARYGYTDKPWHTASPHSRASRLKCQFDFQCVHRLRRALIKTLVSPKGWLSVMPFSCPTTPPDSRQLTSC